MVLSDAQAKQILRTRWPARSSQWPIPGYSGRWMQACPLHGNATLPYLRRPGATLRTTNPDGMYVFVHHPPPPSNLRFADVIAIEVCGTLQNFGDKRSRYNPNNSQLVLPLNWLRHRVTLTNGGVREAWRASEWYGTRPLSEEVYVVRHLRVLFVLTDPDFTTLAMNDSLSAHEYFCKHRQLDQINGPTMQRFIKGMATMRQFSTRP